MFGGQKNVAEHYLYTFSPQCWVLQWARLREPG